MTTKLMERKLTALEAHQEIEKVAAKASQEVRDCTKLKVGEVARQGDIYCHRVEASHPRGKETKNRQLVLGTTQGSRHVAESPALVYVGTTLPDYCEAGTFWGPCVVVPKGKTAIVSHPEHAHMELSEGCWQITHQMDARSRERVQD